MSKRTVPGQPKSLNLPKKYAGLWVAVKGTKVVGAGPTIDKALADASKKGETSPKLVRVPRQNEHYLF